MTMIVLRKGEHHNKESVVELFIEVENESDTERKKKKMIIQTEDYPCVGYQQQSYAVHQESGWYPPSGYHSNVPSIISPPPSNPHMTVYSGGYAQPQEGWTDGKDKHYQTGWHGNGDQYSYGYNPQSCVPNGGYGTYHDGKFPVATTTTVQKVGYSYGSGWGGGDGRHRQVYDQQYPSKGGCQKVEYYAVKGV